MYVLYCTCLQLSNFEYPYKIHLREEIYKAINYRE